MQESELDNTESESESESEPTLDEWGRQMQIMSDRRIIRQRIIVAIGGVIVIAATGFILFVGHEIFYADLPKSKSKLKSKSESTAQLSIDDKISDSLVHYKGTANGHSTEGADKEVLCYIEHVNNNKLGMRLVCSNEPRKPPVLQQKPDPYAGIPVVEPTPDPLGVGGTGTGKGQIIGDPINGVPSLMEVPTRNTWLKEGVPTIASPSETPEPKVIVKSRPVLSKYCSRFLERKGVCKIPRGDYQPTAD